ncbi:S8 family serine peptidase [Legionella lytica]|uniref:S8 family serine peptidase n=1 Tax=Legionella lytica TaxID=96232 RepID=A0ABY4Y7C8_9GAMM|nr:S8 family serine peptidase [Legionella lytica]USQ13130.1 S8 family serine peptidase [Legionella lytica]
MKIRKCLFLLNSVLAFFSLESASFAAKEQCGELLDQIILKYKEVNSQEQPELDKLWWERFSQKSGLPVQTIKPMVSGAYLVVVDSEKLKHLSSAKNISTDKYFSVGLTKILKQPDVQYADRDMRYCLIKPPVHTSNTDPSASTMQVSISHASQWDEFRYPGVMLESAPGLLNGAWSITLGYATPPIVISNFEAINYNPDLAPNLLTGWNFGTHSTDVSQVGDEHGTHTAGTIAATGAIAGITGMGPFLKILPIVPGSLSDLEQGLYWAMGRDIPGVPHNNYPAKVVSMSFNYPSYIGCQPSLQEALDAFIQNNGVITVSAGNDNVPASNNPPRSCNNVMVVAATQINGYRANYSNYGPRVTIAAPGGEQVNGDPCDANGILSTVSAGGGCQNSGFSFYEGTSMATPHVAGIAGLIYAINPYLSSQEVKSILLESVDSFAPTPDPQRSCLGEKSCGVGIINAYKAVKLATSGHTVIAAPSSTDLRLKNSFDPFNRCPPNFYVPTARSIPSPLATKWEINQATRACQPLSAYETPVLQVNGALLTASYGRTVFTLATPGVICRINDANGFIC